jgi:hypothetical protein
MGIVENKPKIKLEITTIGLKLNIRIIFMDELFRHNGSKEIKRFVSSNGFTIHSYKDPGLTPLSIFLWGYDKEKDSSIISIEFTQFMSLNEYINNLEFALKEWSEKWFSIQSKEPVNKIIEF